MTLTDRRILDASSDEPMPEPEERPVRRYGTPWVSYGIIAICAFMTFIGDRYTTGRISLPGHPEATALFPLGGLYGPAVRAGEWWRVFTCVFEHAGLLHLGLNMSVVWTLGTTLERVIKSWRFAIVSIVTALGSSAMALMLTFNAPMVGASGMILGWAGVMLPIATAQGRRSLWIWLVQVAAISLIPHVSWEGHLGGFLFGLPCGFALRAGAPRFKQLAPFLVAGAIAAVYFAGLHGGDYVPASLFHW